MTSTETTTLTGERADLVAMLDKNRFFLRNTARDLTEDQAWHRSTVSELTIGGLIKHVMNVEKGWIRFVLGGAEHMMTGDDSGEDWADGFRKVGDQTVENLLARYDEVARTTNELVATLPDLDLAHELPVAPWFEPGAKWTARRVLMHIIAETAQHAGHADIIRESIDGAKSMG
ncbi:DinB family protein [Allokutzneria sp. A3M-2-11 16]|uniref:DinB family protein n=1 Tax=Allokutzneria sp. A3M-2-11 16 TaxID=2962043 RepID=UPI0020B6BE49|nr:DinB family protein [Allokutzneria sp. A3M-2-11 16]MCP3798343.1 DinB family protein [Allokutzneria sp. A3M-2-11 16]